MKKPKICLAASAGGHLSQLLLLNPAFKGHEIICASTKSLVQNDLKKIGKTYILNECNREHPVQILRALIGSLLIISKEKPSVVISTGAAPGLLMCFWGKLLRSRVVWVDSIANVRNLSLSGRIARPWVDLILSQWPEVAELHENVIYAGELI